MKEGFEFSALNYLTSSDHKSGDDLKYLQNYFMNFQFDKILDVATAAGHCTKVFKSKVKYGVDLSINMLKTARNEFNLKVACANSKSLPFKSGAFDLVTCRIALHHFECPQNFFDEVNRVLTNKGYFVLIHSVVDIEDAYLNVIEYVRDNTHIRSYTLPEIIKFAKDFRLLNYVQINKRHNFLDWAKRLNADEKKVKTIEKKFLNLPNNIKDELSLEVEDENVLSYTDKKGLFIFEKYYF